MWMESAEQIRNARSAMTLASLMLQNYFASGEPNREEFERLYEAMRSTREIYVNLIKESIDLRYEPPRGGNGKSGPKTPAISANASSGNHTLLNAERAQAFQQLQEASGEIQMLVKGNPGLGTDGALLFRQTSAEWERAVQRYRKALQRCDEFIKEKSSLNSTEKQGGKSEGDSAGSSDEGGPAEVGWRCSLYYDSSAVTG